MIFYLFQEVNSLDYCLLIIHFIKTTVFAEGCKLLQAAALGDAKYVQTLLIAHPENIYFRDYDRRTGKIPVF